MNAPQRSKARLLQLNSQTPCSHSWRCPGELGKDLEIIHSVPSGPNVGNGCDCPAYVAFIILKANSSQVYSCVVVTAARGKRNRPVVNDLTATVY